MAKTGRKYFITGGSGFLGINLTRFLLSKGKQVVNYDIATFDYPELNQITSIVGDIRNKKDLERAMQGCDFVVHCAAALPLYSEEEIFSTDVLGTRNVLQVAHKLGIKRVVFISSTSVYGVPEANPVTEEDRLYGGGPYGEAKVLAEKECQKYRQKGLIVPILRPKSFIGPERLGAFAMLYEWAKDGHGFPVIGNGQNRYQFLDVSDLCDAIWLCLTLDKSKIDDVFNVAAKNFKSMKADFQSVLDYAGHGKKIRPIPAWLVIPALKLFEKLKISPLYKWIYESANSDSFVSIEKAEKILGFKPKYSNKDALIRNYKWFVGHFEEFQGKSGISHRVPWSQGILKLFKAMF